MVPGHLKLVICVPFTTEAGLQDLRESRSQSLPGPSGWDGGEKIDWEGVLQHPCGVRVTDHGSTAEAIILKTGHKYLWVGEGSILILDGL